mmetsp:Transcript_114557/g.244384  ORF Transcript_114557/g.244384 Transcript_114557/m.244384 type:complete len:214 (-) Transcript_114557:954-1595(-)
MAALEADAAKDEPRQSEDDGVAHKFDGVPKDAQRFTGNEKWPTIGGHHDARCHQCQHTAGAYLLREEEGEVGAADRRDHLAHGVPVVMLLRTQADEPDGDEPGDRPDERPPCGHPDNEGHHLPSGRLRILTEAHHELEDYVGSAIVEKGLSTDDHGESRRHAQGVKDGDHRHWVCGAQNRSKQHRGVPLPAIGQQELADHGGEGSSDKDPRPC